MCSKQVHLQLLRAKAGEGCVGRWCRFETWGSKVNLSPSSLRNAKAGEWRNLALIGYSSTYSTLNECGTRKWWLDAFINFVLCRCGNLMHFITYFYMQLVTKHYWRRKSGITFISFKVKLGIVIFISLASIF